MKYSWMLMAIGTGVASAVLWLHIQSFTGAAIPRLAPTNQTSLTTSSTHAALAADARSVVANSLVANAAVEHAADEPVWPWPFRNTEAGATLTLNPISESLLPAAPRPREPEGKLYALAYQYNTRIFERPARKPRPKGIVRRGTTLLALERASGKGCKRGAWYRLSSGGYACSRDGFLITPEPRAPLTVQHQPDVDAALPYRYAKMAEGAPRFLEAPSKRELERTLAALASRAASKDDKDAPRLPRVVSDVMDGIYFVALPRTAPADDGEDYYRTVLGRTVRKSDVSFKPDPAMHGELLGKRWQLPLAFVWGNEPADVLGPNGSRRGAAFKHARFTVHGTEVRKDSKVVFGASKLGVDASRVRVARAIARPDSVKAGTRWIHVNLSNQTLVAYDGDRPVFATLVSSGLEDGFATPTGTYRVREKHITTTMSGPDPDKGYYEIAEIPWVQYYHDSYALHGAYWHDEFGQTRSHGCTNIAPADARWLFYFTRPELPAKWHARRRAEGSYIHLTRDEES